MREYIYLALLGLILLWKNAAVSGIKDPLKKFFANPF